MPSFKPGRLAVVSLPANDVMTAAHFYRDVVGLHMLPHHGDRPAFELEDECYLVIVPGKALPPSETNGEPFPAIAFAVEDLDSAIEHLESNGVKTPWGIETSASERWVKFYDPAGNLVEFAQFK